MDGVVADYLASVAPNIAAEFKAKTGAVSSLPVTLTEMVDHYVKLEKAKAKDILAKVVEEPKQEEVVEKKEKKILSGTG